ncbi:hypothetical protein VTN49DRAFT_7910 [Thermomyces lanuginosus]|uniref:uncharacterized protein n=1 Tax=Thermomyces lanuginosus TaxID=5541 RepID=UPI0037425132
MATRPSAPEDGAQLSWAGDGISDLVGWLAALQGPRDTPDPGGFPVEQALVSNSPLQSARLGQADWAGTLHFPDDLDSGGALKRRIPIVEERERRAESRMGINGGQNLPLCNLLIATEARANFAVEPHLSFLARMLDAVMPSGS